MQRFKLTFVFSFLSSSLLKREPQFSLELPIMKFSSFIIALGMVLLLTVAVASSTAAQHGDRRYRRTLGAANFINCLAIGEARQRICSHSLDLLDAIERQQATGNHSCPEGKVFHRHCNVCKCQLNGAFECTTELCAEDFFHATGRPRFW
uniref:Uncharacterized protein n=2 Tax=Anopheles albimanus TaxID=7167 RepID=A0A182FKU0_ANOAL